MTRLDGREDVLVIHTYLVDAELPFLCGKQTLESWNFKIDSREKILEIQTRSDQDCSRKLIKMIDTAGSHYGGILETKKKKKSLDVMFVEDDSGILFLEDTIDDLCSLKAIRKVHEVNHHKGKDQLIAAYRNAGWMSLDLVNMINCVVNDCRVCQKFRRSVVRPRVSLPKAKSFNKSLP